MVVVKCRLGIISIPTPTSSLPPPPPAQDYNGPRETEGIVTYFKRATGDHVIKATSASDWQSNLEEFPVSVLFVAGDAEEQSNIVQVGTSDMCT